MAETPKWPEGPTQANLIERLRNAEQKGREIIVEWDHDPFLFGEAADEIERLRLQIEEGCQAARDFGGEIEDNDDEPKWCVAAAIVADRKKREAA